MRCIRFSRIICLHYPNEIHLASYPNHWHLDLHPRLLLSGFSGPVFPISHRSPPPIHCQQASGFSPAAQMAQINTKGKVEEEKPAGNYFRYSPGIGWRGSGRKIEYGQMRLTKEKANINMGKPTITIYDWLCPTFPAEKQKNFSFQMALYLARPIWPVLFFLSTDITRKTMRNRPKSNLERRRNSTDIEALEALVALAKWINEKRKERMSEKSDSHWYSINPNSRQCPSHRFMSPVPVRQTSI